MPKYEGTNRANRSVVSAAAILEYRIKQLKGKGKQRGGNQHKGVLSAAATPTTEIHSIDSGSSHSPAAPSDSPAPSDLPAHSPITATEVQVCPASFVVEVPILPKATRQPRAAPRAARPPTPTITFTPATSSDPMTPGPIAPSVTHATSSLGAGSAATPISVGAASPSTNRSPSPAIAPALRRYQRNTVLAQPQAGPSTVSRPPRNDTDAEQEPIPEGNLVNRVQTLEKRVGEMEKWKHQVEESLRLAGL